MNDLHYIVKTPALFLCTCCHSEFHDPCITGSRMIAKQFDTFEEAESARKILQARSASRWMVALQEEEDRLTIILIP